MSITEARDGRGFMRSKIDARDSNVFLGCGKVNYYLKITNKEVGLSLGIVTADLRVLQ